MGANFNMKSKKANNVLVSFLERFRRPAKTSAVDNVTSSTATVEEVTGTHLLKIEKFSVQKLNTKGRYIQSATFSIGGQNWNLMYYPNGHNQAKKGYASLYLAGYKTNNVAAYWTCTVLNKKGKELWKRESSIFTFNGNSWGYHDYVDKWKLESGVRKDDRLVLKITVTVVKESIQKCV
ncbi:hypothetical protein LUZ63_011977 [Rhynchospora breviuscula]|uniref:MATH domain-containing protein n=1 Tax=Rhynchospora breviuscula TaxID=2022672 RepID=A0A9Q0HR17_9POAL|nr:hypothetical protein LUZ63_011977 [Rhynchospora breviuscula]